MGLPAKLGNNAVEVVMPESSSSVARPRAAAAGTPPGASRMVALKSKLPVRVRMVPSGATL